MCDYCGCSTPEVYSDPQVDTPAETYSEPATYAPPEVYTTPAYVAPEAPISTDVNPVTGDVGYDAGMARLDWLVAHPEANQDPAGAVPDPTMMGGYGQFGNATEGAVGGVPGHDVPGTPEYTQT
jgi:hypothetical protein